MPAFPPKVISDAVVYQRSDLLSPLDSVRRISLRYLEEQGAPAPDRKHRRPVHHLPGQRGDVPPGHGNPLRGSHPTARDHRNLRPGRSKHGGSPRPGARPPLPPARAHLCPSPAARHSAISFPYRRRPQFSAFSRPRQMRRSPVRHPAHRAPGQYHAPRGFRIRGRPDGLGVSLCFSDFPRG